MSLRILVATTVALATARSANAEATCSMKCENEKLIIAADDVIIEDSTGSRTGLRQNADKLSSDTKVARTDLQKSLIELKIKLTKEIDANITATETDINDRVKALTDILEAERGYLGALRTQLKDHLACSEESKIYIGQYPNGTCEFPTVPVCGGLKLADENRERQGGACVGIYGSTCNTMCKSGFIGGEPLTFKCTADKTESLEEPFAAAYADDQEGEKILHRLAHEDQIYLMSQNGTSSAVEAEEKCAAMGGNLARFDNSMAFRTVLQWAQNNDVDTDNKFWIGLNAADFDDVDDGSDLEWHWGVASNDTELHLANWMYWANPAGALTAENFADRWIPGDSPPHAEGHCAYAVNAPGTGNDGFHNSECNITEQFLERKFICSADRNFEMELHAGTGWAILDGKSGLLEDNACYEVDECSVKFSNGTYADVPGFTPGLFTDYSVDPPIAGLACPVDAAGAEIMECENSVGSYTCTCPGDSNAIMLPDTNPLAAEGQRTAACMVMEDVPAADLEPGAFTYTEDMEYTTEPVTTVANTFAAFSVKPDGRNGASSKYGLQIFDGSATHIQDGNGGGQYQAVEGKTGGLEIRFADPIVLTALEIACIKEDTGHAGGVCAQGGDFDFGNIEVQYWDYQNQEFVTTIELKEFHVGDWTAGYTPVLPGPVLGTTKAAASTVWRVIFPQQYNSATNDGTLENCNGAVCEAPASHRVPEGVQVAEVKITGAKKFVNA